MVSPKRIFILSGEFKKVSLKYKIKTLLKGLEDTIINVVSCTSLTITVCTTLSHVTQTMSDTVIWNYWNNGHHRPTAVAVNSNVYNATCN